LAQEKLLFEFIDKLGRVLVHRSKASFTGYEPFITPGTDQEKISSTDHNLNLASKKVSGKKITNC
jgi:hypothetical protein